MTSNEERYRTMRNGWHIVSVELPDGTRTSEPVYVENEMYGENE